MNYNLCKGCQAECIAVFWSSKEPYCEKCIKALYPYKSDEGIDELLDKGARGLMSNGR
jgi:Fe-S-cluster containining protein